MGRGQSSAPVVATCPHVVGGEGLVLQQDPVSCRRGSVEGELGISVAGRGHTGGTGFQKNEEKFPNLHRSIKREQ